MNEKEFKAYFDSRKIVFCRTPEELRKEFEKFEWKKEDNMDEKTERLYEIDSKISETIKCLKALKELVPKVIEEKEIELENGQIWKHKDGTYYLLETHYRTNSWVLIQMNAPRWSWYGWCSKALIKQVIKASFTLCPDAKIRIIDPETYFHKELP